MPPDENDEERLEKLAGDSSRPFGPPPDASEAHPTRPETDSNIDTTEFYQEGIDGAAGIEEPNADDTVVGFDPQEGADAESTASDDIELEEDVPEADGE